MPIPHIKVSRPHVDEGRQILRHGPETVVHPRTQRRHPRLQHVTTAVKLHLGTVIIIRGPHAADEGDLIGAGPDVGEPVTDLHSAVPVTLVADLKRVNDIALFPVGIIDHDDAYIFQLLRILHAGKRCLTNGLACVFREHGLRVKALHVTHSTSHEEPDDPLCFRRDHRQTTRRLPGFLGFQKGSDGDASKSTEKITPQKG